MASELSEQPATQCIDCGKTHPPRRAALIPSPFQSIVAQEIFPTASETAAIRDFAQETDAEIAWRELAIDRLLCEVAELRRRSEQHKGIIAPIRRVPPEIMAEIFLQLASIEEEEGSDSWNEEKLFEKEYIVGPFLHRAPLIFGEVSRTWRAIALSMPSLWSSISLECNNNKIAANISLCDMWLKRSGSLPLSIHFYRDRIFSSWGEVVTQKNVDHCEDLIEIVLPYANRWRFLDLENLPVSFYDVLHDRLPHYLPMLETLSVSHDSRAESWPTAQSTPWAIAPMLRHLYLDDIYAGNITIGEHSTFPWSQLTHIDVGDCSTYDCLQILSHASTAIACRFVLRRWSSLQHPPVSHSGLETLKIVADDNVPLLWSYLTCPLLSTLRIDTENPGPSSESLPSFITRSGKTIENLRMEGSSMDDIQFMACLTDLPRLQHLHVSQHGYGTQFTNQVWESLTWRLNSPSPLVPDLESLSLVGARDSSHEYIVRMLKSRVQTADSPADFSPKLKFLTLSTWESISASAYNRLIAFGRLGLEITVNASVESDGSGAEDEDEDLDNDGDEDDSDSE